MSKYRELRGIEIFQNGDIQQVDSSTFLVRSQSSKKQYYTVKWERMKWVCNCKDYLENHKKCKHVHAVYYFLTVDKIQSETHHLVKDRSCPQCGQKDAVIKRGVRFNRFGPVQRYYCKRCHRRFTLRKAFKGMKHRADTISMCLDLFYRGLSLRQISQHLKATRNVVLSHTTIYHWLKKYIELINTYLGTLPVHLSSQRWNCDETVLKVKGRQLQLWALLDNESRFFLAQHISEKRDVAAAQQLFKKAVKRSINRPIEIVTDGLESYDTAIRKELGANSSSPLIHLMGTLNEGYNNKVERLNRSIKDRTRTMAGFENKESMELFANGFSIYYNHIRAHASLCGKTPSQAAGVVPDCTNWLDLIVKANKMLSN